MKLKCNRLWRLAKRNCCNICEIDRRKQMMILHKSRFIRNAYCIINWILTWVFDVWKYSNTFLQLGSGRWLRWFGKHLVWVSPPSQVEVWIQEEPWRRWARKGRSGWRNNTMFDAWHKSLTLRGKVWSWTLCEWWRWCPRKAQDNNHRSRCSSSQELLKKICFGVKSEQIFLSIMTLAEAPSLS